MRCAETRGIGLVAIVVVSGCMMVGPDYQRPPVPLAGDWVGRDAGSVAPAAEPIGPWWDTFGDPVLSNLIAEA